MKTRNYHLMKESVEYMKEMDISQNDRRSLIKDCYGPLESAMGFPNLLRNKIMDIYEHSPLMGNEAKNALETSLNQEASMILQRRQGNNFCSSDAI